ncbi:hypothetical protein ABC977_11280 [Thioalkalicoccus limnaeus]|uniref:Cytosolic protein n=1 Tax=Thioalkalicoccus limnaeus TaxID=120681 RepID=A0ABV4BI32_9GAMM
MKALMLISGSGPMLVLTSVSRLDDDVLLSKLRHKGIEKFMAYELPLEEVARRYGGHFEAVTNDIHETDDLRVVDINGHRVFDLFRLDELGKPFVHEPASESRRAYLD